MILGSLFDGSGGFPLAGTLCGITPVWASEVEPYPIAVTRTHFPHMRHLGDISKINGAEIQPVDIITFGSPCQDLSNAGKRAGLKHKDNGDDETTRSGLFMEAVRIITEMWRATNGRYPTFVLWENVPGAFSSNNGEDFRTVLESLVKIVEPGAVMPPVPAGGWAYADSYVGDGWSLAYRTLDAQYWGVPQLRRRIYLVADFAGGSAGEILFESEGVSGYSAESFRTWQRAARGASPCVGATGFDGYNGDLTGDVSATLGVNCGMSTGRNGIVLNDQGGNRMDITDEVTCTLRAESHHPPCVMDAPAVIPLEHHPTDSRIKIEESDAIQTLTSRMGTGGNNVPLVMSDEDAPVTLKIRSGCEGGGKGALLQENKSATLSCNNDQTVFVPKAYGICSKDSNAMKSDNPHSGVYEADTSRTIDRGGGNPTCNQGGIAIVEGNGTRPSHQGAGFAESDVMYTLNTVDRHGVAYAMTTGSFPVFGEDVSPTVLARDYKDPTAVAYGIGRDAFNQGQNAQFSPSVSEEVQPTLVAKGPGAIQSGYIVRRLTPTECARLQGFPDRWGDIDPKTEFTDEEFCFWSDVRNTHAAINGKQTKDYTPQQMVTWYNKLHTDSAEYKMWGNGIALPTALFIMQGIAEASE